MTNKVIKGEGFEFRADKSKVKAELKMVDDDIAVIVLRWLVPGVSE